MGRIEVYMLGLLFWIALILGALALVLTVSGLFSVLSYIVEQRTKEIGVRMAPDASAESVMRLMLARLASSLARSPPPSRPTAPPASIR